MALLDNHDPKGLKHWNKEDIKAETKDILKEIAEYTKRLYAEGERSILVVLQGMDASGKDGLTRTLFGKSSPAWIDVHSFKKPSIEESAHDFLWRIHKCTPKKGMINVFNRSHYEDILVPSVYGLFDPETIESRYEKINQFEKYLESTGTKIIKFYMNLSYDKQEEKLLERINLREKHWKHSDNDWESRDNWNAFMKVYDTIFSRCNDIPWHIIPCDTNWAKLYSGAQILLKELKEINPQYGDMKTDKFMSNYSEK